MRGPEIGVASTKAFYWPSYFVDPDGIDFSPKKRNDFKTLFPKIDYRIGINSSKGGQEF